MLKVRDPQMDEVINHIKTSHSVHQVSTEDLIQMSFRPHLTFFQTCLLSEQDHTRMYDLRGGAGVTKYLLADIGCSHVI
jgi:hypothetical protein